MHSNDTESFRTSCIVYLVVLYIGLLSVTEQIVPCFTLSDVVHEIRGMIHILQLSRDITHLLQSF